MREYRQSKQNCTVPSRDNTVPSYNNTALSHDGAPDRPDRPTRTRVPTRPKRPPIAPQGVAEDGFFEQFWKAYPRKQAKDTARKAWQKRNPGKELTEKILAAISVQRTSDQWTRNGGRYIPLPATWLNGAAWLNEETPEIETSPLRRDSEGLTPRERALKETPI